MSEKIAITEIITTGLNFKSDRIIHISTFVIEENEIKHNLTTYINPERNLEPEFIRSTGILNDNIKFSPKFYEIAKKLILLWSGATLVSSNERITYTFLKSEFDSLGFPFVINHIPFPNYDSGKVLHDRVEEKARILASDFLIQSLEEINTKKDFTPRSFLEKEIKLIPNSCGIYILKNVNGSIVYVGKAKKIRTRLRQHFRNLNSKGFKIHQMVTAIEYITTHSELFALLLEHHHILKWRPELNKALRGDNMKYELRFNEATSIFHFIPLGRSIEGNSLKRFKSKKSAQNYLQEIMWLFQGQMEKVKFHGISDEKIQEIIEIGDYDLMSSLMNLNTLAKSINPFVKGKFQLVESQGSDWIAYVENGFFKGISSRSYHTIEFQKRRQIEYSFQSEYALSLLIKAYEEDEIEIISKE